MVKKATGKRPASPAVSASPTPVRPRNDSSMAREALEYAHRLSLENGTQIEAPGPFTQAVMFAPSPPPPPVVSETIIVDNGLQEAHQNPAGWPDNTQDERQLIDEALASQRRAKAEEHFRRIQENSRTWIPLPVEERVPVASPARSRQLSMIPRPVPHQKVVSEETQAVNPRTKSQSVSQGTPPSVGQEPMPTRPPPSSQPRVTVIQPEASRSRSPVGVDEDEESSGESDDNPEEEEELAFKLTYNAAVEIPTKTGSTKMKKLPGALTKRGVKQSELTPMALFD